MAKKLKYWIKERDNPQLGTFYVGCGQMTKKNAKASENALYGNNVMIECGSEEEYRSRLDELKQSGERVYLNNH